MCIRDSSAITGALRSWAAKTSGATKPLTVRDIPSTIPGHTLPHKQSGFGAKPEAGATAPTTYRKVAIRRVTSHPLSVTIAPAPQEQSLITGCRSAYGTTGSGRMTGHTGVSGEWLDSGAAGPVNRLRGGPVCVVASVANTNAPRAIRTTRAPARAGPGPLEPPMRRHRGRA